MRQRYGDAAATVKQKYGVSMLGEGTEDYGGLYHVQARIWASSAEIAKQAAQDLMDLIAGDCETFIRDEPWGDSDWDYDTNEVQHVGGVRFTTFDRPGPRHKPE